MLNINCVLVFVKSVKSSKINAQYFQNIKCKNYLLWNFLR